ncbi:hypothetical protein P167DRAFT_177146 [Morchella conica CCBAS932]|uniref:Uncharacterized protein n=1 Tax=Morchella conica CCBAS932 TaxID=1392247 RepID=A0A3N4KRE9_9PEZI|nr:hypothetical protein P167DRAFT_177146 [Morchella conica CCBAS932]
MKLFLILITLFFVGITPIVADKLSLCKEICWIHGYFDMDTDCHDSCLASPNPDDSEMLLTEQCVVDCTDKFMSPTVDMRGYTECRSNCYDKALGPFINRFKSGLVRRELHSTEPPEEIKDCIMKCQRAHPQLGEGNPTPTCQHYCRIVMQDQFDPAELRPSVSESSYELKTSDKYTETKSLGVADTPSESPLAKVVEDSSVVKSETNPFNAYNKFHVGAIPATNSTPTGHSARPTPIGEVNGAFSWAESAYCSFWFFAWTSLAIAIAIGTQML